jgi:hypothetical protein
VRVKRLEDSFVKITRIAEPALKSNENIVDVNYEMLIENKYNNSLDVIHECHSMRYFFLPEIEDILSSNGMDLTCAKEWITENEPSDKTWGVCCCAVHKRENKI